jgi:hypothetical protein
MAIRDWIKNKPSRLSKPIAVKARLSDPNKSKARTAVATIPRILFLRGILRVFVS